ncbi:MAG: hypothetical protein LUE11_10670 [Clostridia bacterium]|nr:hypothetical protein [Clostridia bacterium]
MRRTRMVSVIVCVIAVAAFILVRVQQYLTDTSGPKISMDADSITVSAAAEESDLLEGITAEDRTDGDVTDNLMVESMSNLMEGNTRNMTVVAFDSDGHVTKVERKVTYSDYKPAQFTLDGPLQYVIGSDMILNNIGATDLLDGDLSSSVKITDQYTMPEDEPGEYPMEFTVTNSAGDVSKLTATVTLMESSEYNSMAKIELSDYIVYTPKDQALNLMGYVQAVEVAGKTYEKNEAGELVEKQTTVATAPQTSNEKTIVSMSNIETSGKLDYSTPGTYEVTYTYTDESLRSGSVRMIVVVTD